MSLPARLAAALLLLAAPPALAADPPAAGQGYPIDLKVGESDWLCERPQVQCPAVAPVCDDPSVAGFEDGGSRGLKLVGRKPGRTLCSVGMRDTTRRVFSVTVR